MSTALNLDRRDCLKTAAAAAASVAAGAVLPTAAAASGESAHDFPIVDTHQHLWDLKKFRLPWLADASAKPLAKSYLPADYAAAIEGLGVVESVYMEVDVQEPQQDAEADYVIGLCRAGKTTMTAAVISGRPERNAFGKYIARFKEEKVIKGIRRLLDAPGITPEVIASKTMVANIRLLGELGMSFDLHPRVAELRHAAGLVDACPDTRFVLDHCGCIAPTATGKVRENWKKDISEIARRKNVVCKISGIIANAPEKWTARDLAPTIDHCLDAFGPDRVMFASDWPVCTLRATFAQWVAALREIVGRRPQADQKKLFHDNAVAFYDLRRSGD